MAPASRRRIFPISLSRSSRRRGVGSGKGLGLTISQGIVGDRHGGEIEVESKGAAKPDSSFDCRCGRLKGTKAPTESPQVAPIGRAGGAARRNGISSRSSDAHRFRWRLRDDFRRCRFSLNSTTRSATCFCDRNRDPFQRRGDAPSRRRSGGRLLRHAGRRAAGRQNTTATRRSCLGKWSPGVLWRDRNLASTSRIGCSFGWSQIAGSFVCRAPDSGTCYAARLRRPRKSCERSPRGCAIWKATAQEREKLDATWARWRPGSPTNSTIPRRPRDAPPPICAKAS